MATRPKPKKEQGKAKGMSITPYPRSGESSRDGGGASQGGDTYRILKASWGEEPMVEKEKEAEKKGGKTKKKECQREN